MVLRPSPKQTLVTDGERVGVLCQLISLVWMGMVYDPKGREQHPLWTALAPTSAMANMAYLMPALVKDYLGMIAG